MVTPMRHRVTTGMTVLTVVVVGLSWRASAQGQAAPAAVAPAGIVAAAPRGTTPSSAPPSKTPRSPKARASRARTATKAPTTSTTSSAPTTSKAPRAAQTHTPRHKATSTPTPIPSPSSVTVNGGVADTMFGPVQVQVTVRGGRIVGAHAIVYPQGGGRDQQINSRAIPQLDQETVAIQSARIDTVSGATYTSDGYRRSLQSALDAAHVA
jgi:uncharacterized protein with FMN-binding domain